MSRFQDEEVFSRVKQEKPTLYRCRCCSNGRRCHLHSTNCLVTGEPEGGHGAVFNEPGAPVYKKSSLLYESHSSFLLNRSELTPKEPPNCCVPTLAYKNFEESYVTLNIRRVSRIKRELKDALKRMSELDYHINKKNDNDRENFQVYVMKYYRNDYVLVYIRLVQIKDEGFFIAIRKLEGDGFLISDEFQPELESQLSHICTPSDAVGLPIEGRDLFFDLEDDVVQEALPYWLQSLRPQSLTMCGGMNFDWMQVHDTVSNLAYNFDPENNSEVLALYVEEFIDCLLIVLSNSKKLSTSYFTSLCISNLVRCYHEYLVPRPIHIEMLIQIIEKWSNPQASIHIEPESSNLANPIITCSYNICKILIRVIILVAHGLKEIHRSSSGGDIIDDGIKIPPSTSSISSKFKNLESMSESSLLSDHNISYSNKSSISSTSTGFHHYSETNMQDHINNNHFHHQQSPFHHSPPSSPHYHLHDSMRHNRTNTTTKKNDRHHSPINFKCDNFDKLLQSIETVRNYYGIDFPFTIEEIELAFEPFHNDFHESMTISTLFNETSDLIYE